MKRGNKNKKKRMVRRLNKKVKKWNRMKRKK
jgi:hypothetical protein